MASAQDYATWIVRNKDKKGTAEFDKVAQAYSLARQQETPAPAAIAEPAAAPEPETGFVPVAKLLLSLANPVAFARQYAVTTPEDRATALSLGVGLAAGPVVGTGLRAVAAGAPRVAKYFLPAAKSFETGGFQSGLATTAPKTAQIGVRTVGAAVPGAAAGAVAGGTEEAGTGAAISTGIAFVAPPVAKVLSKGVGAVADAVLGRSADVSANKLVQQTIGNEINALRVAMQAQPDAPASRVAADLDLPVLQALLRTAEDADPAGVVNAFRKNETQDIANYLARMSGGATQTEARAARAGAKETLGRITTPMREEAFEAAGQTGRVMPRLELLAEESRAAAKGAVDRVRRFVPAADRALDWAKNWSASGGARAATVGAAPRPPARYTFPGQLADRADVRATEAAAESLQAGGAARAAENTLQSMKDRGLAPITANTFTGAIDRMLRDPDVALNPTLARALPQVRQMFDDWAAQNGVITPEAVYAIRKNGISGVIQQLMPNADAQAQRRMAAEILGRLRPVMDDAIEKAGGKGWKDYLRTFEQGMTQIDEMELADVLQTEWRKGTSAAKTKILNILSGQDPKVVEKIFGGGKYNIGKVITRDKPFLDKLQSIIDLDLKAAAQARAGRASLEKIQAKRGARLRFPFFTRATTATNEVLAAIEAKVQDATADAIINAAKSGRSFAQLLDALPTAERNKVLAQFKNAQSWNGFSRDVALAARSFAVDPREPEPEPEPTNSNFLRR
jgi:hypothetical protein